MASGRSETTFVCCIEAGPLEPLSLRLAESIRRHAGRFSQARIIACQPRFGAPLAKATRARLEELGAEHVWLHRPRRRDWYHYLNKAEALVQLQPGITTDWVTFLDSDILIGGEPGEIVGDDIDFAAAAPDDGIVGSTGPGHPLDAMWLRYIASVGVSPERVPMIEEYNTRKEIRLYFNSGLFSYRVSTGFADVYRDTVHKALTDQLGFPYHFEHYTDQVVLGLVALKMDLRWRRLSYGYNLAVDRSATELPDDLMRQAVVLHYHKALERNPQSLFERLGVTHPQIAAWLAEMGGAVDPRSLPAKAFGEALRVARGVPRKLYRRGVRLQGGEKRSAAA
ncbi:MAG: hypothetical protein JSR98_18065 [Proteobacteria bacterium]|nr:hypothetical protein [Pseudomonadota bacterium]